MPLILPPPETQFCDANGVPYAGGTVTTYVPGTDTLKDTWQDNGGSVLNTNPVVLDAAGRGLIFGDGDYRCVLKDADGNLIYDQWTSSVISDAMQPVVRAATIADALNLLGVTAAIQVETNRATAAEGTLTNNLNAEVTRATNAEANLQSQISGLGGSGVLPAGYSIRYGFAASGSDGSYTVTVSPTFTNGIDNVVTTAGRNVWASVDNISGNTFSGWTSSPEFGGSWNNGPQGFHYIAIGH